MRREIQKFLSEGLNPKGEKEVTLFMGRMQPIHKGHVALIRSLKNPVIVIVKGGASSQDKESNPLDFETQKTLINKVFPDVEVFEYNKGFLPPILNMLRFHGLEVTKLIAGPDRAEGYRNQINKTNERMPSELVYDVKVEESKPISDGGDVDRISATLVRKAIRSGDEETFRKLTPKAIHSDFDKLKSLMESCEEEYINEAAQIAAAGIARATAGALKNAETSPAVRKAVTRLSTGATALAKKAEPAIRKGLEKSKPLIKQGIKRGLERLADRNKPSSDPKSNTNTDDDSNNTPDPKDLDKKTTFLGRAKDAFVKKVKMDGPRALFKTFGGEDVPILDKMFTYWDDDRKAQMIQKGENERQILIGEFRPFHNSHLKNYKQMEKPAIVVLKNDDFAFQKKLIQLVLPKADVYSTKRDDLPAILAALRLNSSIEPTVIRVHPSKIEKYKKQIADANKKLKDDVKYDVTFEPLVAEKVDGEDITSEMVREAIKNKDFNKLKKLVPEKVAERYHELIDRKTMQEDVNINTTASMAITEKPFSRMQKRKELEDIEDDEVHETPPVKRHKLGATK